MNRIRRKIPDIPHKTQERRLNHEIGREHILHPNTSHEHYIQRHLDHPLGEFQSSPYQPQIVGTSF